jgi:hypothetical protein
MKFTFAIAMLLFSSATAINIKGPETGEIIHICNGANSHKNCQEPDDVFKMRLRRGKKPSPVDDAPKSFA